MLACNGFIKQYTCPIEKIYALSHSLYKPSEGYMTLSLEAAIASGCITCDILSLSLGFVIAGYRRPFTDACLQTSVYRYPLYVCSLCYIQIYIAAGWIVHRRIKQVVSDQFRVFVVISQQNRWSSKTDRPGWLVRYTKERSAFQTFLYARYVDFWSCTTKGRSAAFGLWTKLLMRI
jgi:hypothetical protein